MFEILPSSSKPDEVRISKSSKVRKSKERMSEMKMSEKKMSEKRISEILKEP